MTSMHEESLNAFRSQCPVHISRSLYGDMHFPSNPHGWGLHSAHLYSHPKRIQHQAMAERSIICLTFQFLDELHFAVLFPEDEIVL